MPFHERNAKNRCADMGVLRIPTVRFGSRLCKNSSATNFVQYRGLMAQENFMVLRPRWPAPSPAFP